MYSLLVPVFRRFNSYGDLAAVLTSPTRGRATFPAGPSVRRKRSPDLS